MKKNSSKAWFYGVRGSYLPNSAVGLIIYLVYVAYLVTLGILWYQQGHTAWQFIVSVVPLASAAVFAVQYIASKHSK